MVNACNKDSRATPALPRSLVKPKAPVAAQAGPHRRRNKPPAWWKRRPRANRNVPVELKFELTQRPKVGQPLEINLALIPQIDGESRHHPS